MSNKLPKGCSAGAWCLPRPPPPLRSLLYLRCTTHSRKMINYDRARLTITVWQSRDTLHGTPDFNCTRRALCNFRRKDNGARVIWSYKITTRFTSFCNEQISNGGANKEIRITTHSQLHAPLAVDAKSMLVPLTNNTCTRIKAITVSYYDIVSKY